MIVIVDLGLGNINSVSRALRYLGALHSVSSDAAAIESADKLILPGVGNFSEASRRIYSGELADRIMEQVIGKRKPLLGICLGMQLLAESGEEGGASKGLGIIKANVSKLKSEQSGNRLPHIGWNDVANNGMKLFSGVPDHTPFYFVHSYAMTLDDKSVKSATCNYGVDFVAAIQKENVCGTQFHPEKSQGPGLQVLKNFINGEY